MELHTCLWNDVAAFDFNHQDLAPVAAAFPHIKLVMHDSEEEFLSAAATAAWVLTWDFRAEWYKRCLSLRAVFTPAAGNDWVAADPAGKVPIIHGTFHGTILSESLLGALLFMNHRMPDMIRNHQRREWDRNLQRDCRLLRNQCVLIIGLGHIGSGCARVIRQTGARVIGIKRDPSVLVEPMEDVDVRGIDRLVDSLGEADHVIMLLPGDSSTDHYLDANLLRCCKRGACVYNFGRGNALGGDDLLGAMDWLGGAFLDVVEDEPLPKESPLWAHPRIMITPHSSCVYREYKSAFVDEVINRGRGGLFG